MKLTCCIFWMRKTNFPYWVKVMERQEPAFFVASSANALAGQANVTLERLLQEPFVLTERGISYRYAMEQALAEKGMELHPFLETGNTDVITKLLLENQGVSFLPEFVVREYLKSGRPHDSGCGMPRDSDVEPAGLPQR